MRGAYGTRQKREMLAYLKNHDMEPYSVDELVFKMQEQGERIGRTTVYRYLEQLAEQGSVRKYQNAQGVTRYQHIEDDSHCDSHFHMMCRSCGRLYHVSCDLMEQLSKHIYTDHSFRLDLRETILVGTCARCAGGEVAADAADSADGCHHCL